MPIESAYSRSMLLPFSYECTRSTNYKNYKNLIGEHANTKFCRNRSVLSVANVTDIPRLEVAKFPRNARCAVTTSWDDNDNRNIEIMKILDAFNIKGTFYIDTIGLNKTGNVHTDLRGDPSVYKDGLTDSQLRMLSVNHEIGSHTWTHSHSHAKSPDSNTLRKEYGQSKEHLENILKQPVLGIAYPYGLHTTLSERISRECGYLFARTLRQGNIVFPPTNPFQWGISVAFGERSPTSLSQAVFSRWSILFPQKHFYLRNRSWNWRTLALKLFEKARARHGVLHIFSHASSLVSSGLKRQFVEFCGRVAFKDDVWYATNGLLFINEIVRNSVQIDQVHHDNRSIFSIRSNPALAPSIRRTPTPLRLEVPRVWRDFKLQVVTSNSGWADIGKLQSSAWIDIFDNEAKIEVTRG